MCGRFVVSASAAEIAAEFATVQTVAPEGFGPDYNVAPTKEALVVAQRPHQENTPEREPERHLRAMRWGLVPSWAKDVSFGARTFNARLETASTKPSFRSAWRRRRCIVPVRGYYEWYTPVGGGPKQPFFITPSDGSTLAMAGLFEIWHGDDVPVWSFTVLTREATPDLAPIHDRMPVVLPSEKYAQWLDPSLTDSEEVALLIDDAVPGLLTARPVSRAVGNVANNHPGLIEPLPPEAAWSASEQPTLIEEEA